MQVFQCCSALLMCMKALIPKGICYHGYINLCVCLSSAKISVLVLRVISADIYTKSCEKLLCCAAMCVLFAVLFYLLP